MLFYYTQRRFDTINIRYEGNTGHELLFISFVMNLTAILIATWRLQPCTWVDCHDRNVYMFIPIAYIIVSTSFNLCVTSLTNFFDTDGRKHVPLSFKLYTGVDKLLFFDEFTIPRELFTSLILKTIVHSVVVTITLMLMYSGQVSSFMSMSFCKYNITTNALMVIILGFVRVFVHACVVGLGIICDVTPIVEYTWSNVEHDDDDVPYVPPTSIVI